MSDAEVARFTERQACIGCGHATLDELSAGRFDQGAVQRFIEADPWGEHPAPFLRGQPWSFVSCRACGLAFHRRILDPVWNERRFARWMSQQAIDAYEQRIRTPEGEMRKGSTFTAHVLRIERLTRGLRGNRAPRVLDFGCGYGSFLAMCALYGFEAYGVDRSAARRGNNRYGQVFAEIDEVAHLAPFDALTLFEVLEHLDEPQPLLARLATLLAPGGILVLETPDCSGVRGIETRSDYDKIHPLEHINAFTPKTLAEFATRLGFEPLRPPAAYVSTEWGRLARTLAKQVLAPLRPATTQLYFRKIS